MLKITQQVSSGGAGLQIQDGLALSQPAGLLSELFWRPDCIPCGRPPPPPAEQIALCTVHKTYEEAPVLGPRPQCLGSPDPSFQLAVSPPRAVTGLDCQIAHVFSAHKFERYAWILNSQIVPQSTLFTYTYSFSAFYLSSNKRKCSNSVWTFFTLK